MAKKYVAEIIRASHGAWSYDAVGRKVIVKKARADGVGEVYKPVKEEYARLRKICGRKLYKGFYLKPENLRIIAPYKKPKKKRKQKDGQALYVGSIYEVWNDYENEVCIKYLQQIKNGRPLFGNLKKFIGVEDKGINYQNYKLIKKVKHNAK